METYEAMQCEKCGSPITTVLPDGKVKCDYCGLIYTRRGTPYEANKNISPQGSFSQCREYLSEYEKANKVPYLNASLEIIRNSSNPADDFAKIRQLHGEHLILIEEQVEPRNINNNEIKPYKYLHPFDSQLLLSSSKEIDSYHKEFRDQLCEEFKKLILKGELIVFRNAYISPLYSNLGLFSQTHSSYDNPFSSGSIFGSEISGYISKSPYEKVDGITIKAYINETIKELYIQGLLNAQWCKNYLSDPSNLAKFRKYYGIDKTMFTHMGFSFLLGRTLIQYYDGYEWLILNKPFNKLEFDKVLSNYVDPDSEKKKIMKKMYNSCNKYELCSYLNNIEERQIFGNNGITPRPLSEKLYLGRYKNTIFGYSLCFNDLSDNVSIKISYGSSGYSKHISEKSMSLGKLDDAFITLAHYSNRCTKCGGKFKMFKNVCSKCGSKKDY